MLKIKPLQTPKFFISHVFCIILGNSRNTRVLRGQESSESPVFIGKRGQKKRFRKALFLEILAKKFERN